MITKLWSKRFVLILLPLFAIPQPARATAGLAEWEITTPGGNLISSIDPYISQHGICIRVKETVLVSHLRWWVYYRGFVAGSAEQEFFLFDEKTRSVRRFATEVLLDQAIAVAKLGPPLRERMDGAAGWRETWEPLLRERCRMLEQGGGDFAQMSAEERKRIRELVCAELGKAK